jgi:hypothetical protein
MVDGHNAVVAAGAAAEGSGSGSGSGKSSSAAAAAAVELVAICPSVIVGPPRTGRTDSESLQLMAAVLDGGNPTRGATPMVDVRDCAAAVSE